MDTLLLLTVIFGSAILVAVIAAAVSGGPKTREPEIEPDTWTRGIVGKRNDYFGPNYAFHRVTFDVEFTAAGRRRRVQIYADDLKRGSAVDVGYNSYQPDNPRGYRVHGFRTF